MRKPENSVIQSVPPETAEPRSVGILTFHCVDNFGAVLQAYALQKALSRLGCRPEFIDYCPDKLLEPFKILQNPFDKARPGLVSKLKGLVANILYLRSRLSRKKKFSSFRKRWLCVSGVKYSRYDQLKDFNAKYDSMVVGSDQVWNPNILGEVDPAYFFAFGSTSVKRIAYAASIGETVPDKYHSSFREYLPGFDYVSVREATATGFIGKYTSSPVRVTLDPTFLIPESEWGMLASQFSRGKYILVYDIWTGPEMCAVVDCVSAKLGLPVVSYSGRGLYRDEIDGFYYEGPAEFLGLLRNAEFVVTSSYHGTTLSIIHEKKFVTVPHPVRGSRMRDLLDLTGLSCRLVRNPEDIGGMDLGARIDYSQALSVIDRERASSISFLSAALH